MRQEGLPHQLSSSPAPKHAPCSIAHHPRSPGAALCGGWAVKHAQGRAKAQEDAYSIHELSASALLPQGLLLGVYDGHGGDEVALHAAARLHDHFASSLAAVDRSAGDADSGADSADSLALEFTNSGVLQSPPPSPLTPCAPPLRLPEPDCMPVPAAATDSSDAPQALSLVSQALRSSFRMTDEELAGTDEGEFVGSTGLVVVLGPSHIWVAHCGDSRAALQRGGSAIALTSDHKPTREDEETRIRSAGGRIVYSHGAPRVMGMLAMTRSIGDHYLRPYIIAEPEVVCVERSEDDEVLILATDGLWDVFTCTEATSMASRCIQRSRERGMSRHGACQVATSVLTQAAMDRGSRDNVTVVVVSLAARDAHDEEVELKGAGGHPLRHAFALKCNSGTCSPGFLSRALHRQAASHDDLTKLGHGDDGDDCEADDVSHSRTNHVGSSCASAAAAALDAVLSLGGRLQRGTHRPPRHRPPARSTGMCGPALSSAACGAAELLRLADACAGPHPGEVPDEVHVQVQVQEQPHGQASHPRPLLVHADTLVRSAGPVEPCTPVSDGSSFVFHASPGSIAGAAGVAQRSSPNSIAAAAAAAVAAFEEQQGSRDPFAVVGSLEDSDEEAAAESALPPSSMSEEVDKVDGLSNDQAGTDTESCAATPVGAKALSQGDDSEAETWSGSLPRLLPRLAGDGGSPSHVQGHVPQAGTAGSATRGRSHSLEPSGAKAMAAMVADVPGACSPAFACSAPGPAACVLLQQLGRGLAPAGSVRGDGGEEDEAALQRASWLSVEVPGMNSAVAVFKMGGCPGAVEGTGGDEWEWSRASVP